MLTLCKYLLCFFILMGIGLSSLYSIVPTETGQRMIEESNKMYSGNKYNLPQDQYNRLQQQAKYNQSNYPIYYQNYRYYKSYPYSYYNSPDYYNSYPYEYDYGYYGAIPPPAYYEAFPDKARADALYEYLRNR